MPAVNLRLGTRGSMLAMRQSEGIAQQLRKLNPQLTIQIIIIQSTGDQILSSPLWQIGGKGLFTREIEVALLEEKIDFAVHSLKDLPTTNTPGLTVSAVTTRESPWDLLLAEEPIELEKLAADEILGTSSLRRQALLRVNYPNLNIHDLRGNVPTRLNKMKEGNYKAIVLAEAGINRLGLKARFMRRLREDELLPAPGQGALGIQTRSADVQTISLVQQLHHQNTAACTSAERALLHHLGGGCQAPLGAYAHIQGDQIVLSGRVVSKDCKEQIQGTLAGALHNPDDLGKRLAAMLHQKGASEWMKHWQPSQSNDEVNPIVAQFEAEMKRKPLYNIPVIVTREEDADGPVSRALRTAGASPICVPLVHSSLMGNTPDMKLAVQQIDSYDWVILTSKRALQALIDAGLNPVNAKKTQWACVGEGTAERLLAFGIEPKLQSALKTGESLAHDLVECTGSSAPSMKVLFPKSNISSETLPKILLQASMSIHEVVAYETTLSDKHHSSLVNLLATKQARCLVFCSPSAVDSFYSAWELIPEAVRFEINRELIFASIGPSTSQRLREHRFNVLVESKERTFENLISELEHYYPAAINED